MKTGLFYLMAAVLTVSIASCTATYAVRERPAEVEYRRPPAPSPNHVWVSGNWVWRGGRYVWQEGYWTLPRRHAHYVEGFWTRSHGGWVWHPGHWQG